MSTDTLLKKTETRKVNLDDRYTSRFEPVLINGVQSLVRLMLVQAESDAAAGIKTGGFVSGYRGSPLGGLDTAFAGAGDLVRDRGIVVKPAVNEELAATAIAGSQQIEHSPGAKVEGVFSLWYGKGPGLDQASDAIRHGVQQGTSAKGGVVMAVGDDHLSKSSSIVCCSDDMVAGLKVPLFYPADAAEIVEYGLHGFAVSRHTGSWTALKIITEVADATRTISGNELPFEPVLPEVNMPATGLHNQWPDTPLEQERRHVEYRLPAVKAYVRANGLDRIVLKKPGARIGLIAAGKSWLDLREALRLLGLNEERLAALGVALYKPAMIWPLEPEGLAEFTSDLETVFVVEEKGGLIEAQAKAILYNHPDAPAIYGKTDADGRQLMPAVSDLTPEQIAGALGLLIGKVTGDKDVVQRGNKIGDLLVVQTELSVAPQLRKPYFCSGCPHNRSTVLPEGSRALAGIGCHGLAAYNQPSTETFSQMGGEGVGWMGLSPFTDEPHIFANMGDGTYFHSGMMAIRQAAAAKLNITYKLLYNSAVAMTGGQSVDGELSVSQLVDQILAEGVSRVVICADDLTRYPSGDPVRSKVEKVVHRDEFEALQREMRELKGVSVIIYDQICATEKRRLRKRGKYAQPDKRVFINELVCEGCGDCSVKSNCLSVEPVATQFGTKRRINQTTCNTDYSCLDGFCPSFVTVEGGKLRRGSGNGISQFDVSTLPPAPETVTPHQRVIVGGIGGTGVVTIGALISMASHISGRRAGVLDQTGMAQKGGAVISHIHIAEDDITALRVPPGEADIVIACDQVVANQRDVIAAISPERTRVLANSDVAITGDFTKNRDAAPDASLLERRLRRQSGDGNFNAHPFTHLAEKLFGNALGANLMMMGYARQKGWLNLDIAALDAALELNGTAIEMNRAAFAWGRRLAVDPDAVYAACGMTDEPEEQETLDEIISRRKDFLQNFQNADYANRYASRLSTVQAAETRVGGDGKLTETAAKALFRLMSYKDEYEVARLFTDGSFTEELRKSFEGTPKISYHMAPPILGRKDKTTGHPRKQRFGMWMSPVLRILAKGRMLRGTFMDPFGYTAERRLERAMIADYEALLERILADLNANNLEEAVKLAGLVLEVRGYGHVKEAAQKRYQSNLPKALEAFESADANNREYAAAG